MNSTNFDWDLLAGTSNSNNNSNNNSTNNSGNTSPYNSSYGDISLMTTFNSNSNNNNNNNNISTSIAESNSPAPGTPSSDPRFIIHTLTPKDTLQGLSLKYNVKINDLKRANNLWTQDTLFIKKTLLIPIENSDGSNNSGSIGSSPLNTSSNSISYKSSNSMSTGKSSNGNNDVDHNSMFPEFEPMAKSFSSPKEKPILPKRNTNNINNGSFHSVPMSTLSFSPVVNSLDHKTQSQFSLLDEELNPL